jgi:hypothetical protein
MKRLMGIGVLGLAWCATGDHGSVEVTTAPFTIDARTQVLTRSAVAQTLETWVFSSIRTAPNQKIDTSTPLGTLVLIR